MLRRFTGQPTALEQATKIRPAVPNQRLEPLPAPAGRVPYRLALADVLDQTQIQAIRRAGGLRFHCVGDTGALQNPGPQRRVVAAMLAELGAEDPVRFFHHLGDVVYLYGEQENYGAQFFEPYAEYAAPIFAIPGNHDGDPAPGRDATSLEAFARHFCATATVLKPNASPGHRAAMTQPNVYWTLLHDWATIIGLYTNVPEGGAIADDQLRWLMISDFAALLKRVQVANNPCALHRHATTTREPRSPLGQCEELSNAAPERHPTRANARTASACAPPSAMKARLGAYARPAIITERASRPPRRPRPESPALPTPAVH